VAFFRLKSPGGLTTDWNQGLAIQAQGGARFALTPASESIPGFPSFPQATLHVQFVAEDAAGGILGRTPVYSDVAFEICNR
jgi:hypothetical protein